MEIGIHCLKAVASRRVSLQRLGDSLYILQSTKEATTCPSFHKIPLPMRAVTVSYVTACSTVPKCHHSGTTTEWQKLNRLCSSW
jgi:hypothetical protein